MFLPGSKVLMALIKPMEPMEIKSSMWIPVFSNLRATYTTSRRLRSMSVFFTSAASGVRRRSRSASSSGVSGAGSASLPPMYKIGASSPLSHFIICSLRSLESASSFSIHVCFMFFHSLKIPGQYGIPGVIII